MYCRRCGKQIPDDSVVCQYCGTEIVIEPVLEDSFEDTAAAKQTADFEELANSNEPDGMQKAGSEEQVTSIEPGDDLETGAAELAAESAREVSQGAEAHSFEGTSYSAETGGSGEAIVPPAAPKPKRKKIIVGIVAAAAVVIIAVVGVMVFGGIGFGSDPIVGQWQSLGDSVETAEVTEEGIEIKSSESSDKRIRLSGTWSPIPEKEWPEDIDRGSIVGCYEFDLNMKVDGLDAIDAKWLGVVSKVDNNYLLVMMWLDRPDTKLYFTRS